MHEIRSRKVRRILRLETRAAALQRRHEAAMSRAARFTARELELRQAARDRIEFTRRCERTQGRIIPWVFHRKGEPVKSMKRSWRTAWEDAAVPGRLMHDLRRTAVRNLEPAGVSRSVAMKMTGHETESVHRRYAIVSEVDLKETGAKLASLQLRGGVSEPV